MFSRLYSRSNDGGIGCRVEEKGREVGKQVGGRYGRWMMGGMDDIFRDWMTEEG